MCDVEQPDTTASFAEERPRFIGGIFYCGRRLRARGPAWEVPLKLLELGVGTNCAEFLTHQHHHPPARSAV
jgi:hypothetical protein